MSQQILCTEIEYLELSVRSYNSLKRAGIDRLDQIISLGENGVQAIRGLGQVQFDEIFDSVAAYLKVPRSDLARFGLELPPSLDESNTETTVAFVHDDLATNDAEIPEAPPESSEDDRPMLIEITPQGLPNPIDYIVPLSKELLQQSRDKREFEIVRRRFGLQGSKEYTLQEVGYYYDVTRERVRQLESGAMSKIRDTIFGIRNSSAWRVPENLVSETTALFDLLQATGDLLTETEIINIVETRYSSQISPNQVSDLRFLLSVFGFKSLPNNLPGFGRGSVSGWIVSEKCKSQLLYEAAKSVHRIVNSSAGTISTFDLMIQVNKLKKKKSERYYVRLAAKILIDIEQVDEENFQVKFEYLTSSADQAYRILLENKRPLHLRELQREINHRFAAQGLPADSSIRNLGNQLATDPRFKSIGRSGLSSLSEWENVQRKTIVELMEEFFHVRQTSATATEIYEYVSDRRSDISKQSVYTYLSMLDTFVKVDRNLYELSAWGSKPSQTNNRRTAKEIEDLLTPAIKQIYDSAPGKSMPLRDLIRLLHEQTSIPEATLYLHIKKTSLLQTKPDSSYKRRKLAIYVGESHISEQQHAPRVTLREKVRQEVEKYLQSQPNRKATVASLVPHIKKTTGCGRHTFYQYLSAMADAGLVRKDYEGRNLVCFLETAEVFETELPLTFPQVEQITDEILKAQLVHRKLNSLTYCLL